MILEFACRPTKGQEPPPEVESLQPNPFLKACSQTPSPASDRRIAAVVACEDISGRGSRCGRFWFLQPQTLAWCSALGLSSRRHPLQFHSLTLETRAGSPSYQGHFGGDGFRGFQQERFFWWPPGFRTATIEAIFLCSRVCSFWAETSVLEHLCLPLFGPYGLEWQFLQILSCFPYLLQYVEPLREEEIFFCSASLRGEGFVLWGWFCMVCSFIE